MAPAGKVSKMKQVCAASPGKFASALLDILDGSVEESLGLPLPFSPEQSPAKEKGMMRKRPAAACNDVTPTKKRKTKESCAEEVKPPSKAKVQEKAKQDKLGQSNFDKEKATQRRKELKTLKLVRIKEMVVRKGLALASKEKMVESIIELEAKSRANIRKHKANVRDVVSQKREEFAGKSSKQLKELLQAYALQTSGTKTTIVDRLLGTWKEQGEIEKVLAGMAFQARKVELNALDKEALFEMCRKKGVDALSKEILVERLLVHETVEIWQEVMEARRQMP